MKIIIPSNTKLFQSIIGEKGFLYPSESSLITSEEAVVQKVSYVHSKEHGLCPVQIINKSGESEDCIFWISKEYVREQS